MIRNLLSIVWGLGLWACGPVDPCRGGGTATLKVTLNSSMAGAKATLTGPDGVAREVTSTDALSTVELTGLASGRWTVQPKRYVLSDARVRTVYDGVADPATFCVAQNGVKEVTVTWSVNPASNKLWALNGSGGSGALLGFPASSLMSSGSVPATAKGDGPMGRDVAFDREGNLWALGATTNDATVVMTASAVLNTTEKKTATRSITVPGISCFPGPTAIAFDPSGNLWVSSRCEKRVFKLTADQIRNAGTVTPTVELSHIETPSGLAFDRSGNLFVAATGAGAVFRFDASGLNESWDVFTKMPSAVFQAKKPGGSTESYLPDWLAFDSSGNLYVDDLLANVIYRLGASDLGVTGVNAVEPQVHVTLDVTAVMEGLVFDEAGGLWVAFTAGHLARLDPSQLNTSTGAGAPTVPQLVFSSPDLAYGSNLAIYPAPASLPLFHSLP